MKRFKHPFLRGFSAVLVCAMLITGGARQAQAQICEVGAASIVPVAIAAQTAAVLAAQMAIMAAVEAERMASNAAIGAAINLGWSRMQGRLNEFWPDWLQAMKDQIKQLNAGQIDQTQQLAEALGASGLNEVARREQQSENEAKQDLIVSDEACRFDTTARYMGRSMQLGKAVAGGFAGRMNQIGNNKRGTPAANGNAGMQRTRWDNYVNILCDPTQNSGTVPCTATTHANEHITPSKTVFAKETINVDDPETLIAVRELIYNISGYRTPDVMAPDAQSSAKGKEKRQTRRENMAQMDAVGALLWSVIGERAIGENAPEIQQLRVRAGSGDASPRPSEREIRQKTLEDLWDPTYYTELDGPRGTIEQKEIYLKAYKLVNVYNLIRKNEMIANVYAIEGANMLAVTDTSRGSASHSAPGR